MEYYKATANNMHDIANFFAKKLNLKENEIEFNLLNGKLSFIDNINGEKQLITKLEI